MSDLLCTHSHTQKGIHIHYVHMYRHTHTHVHTHIHTWPPHKDALTDTPMPRHAVTHLHSVPVDTNIHACVCLTP